MSKFSETIGKLFNPSARGRVRWAVFAVLLLAILAGLLDYPKYWDKGADAINSWAGFNVPHFYSLPFRLGLDLQGGSHLVYEADMANIPDKDQSSAIDGVRDVIERRVNAFGVAEPIVQTSKVASTWRVIVDLAGVKDIGQAIQKIGETPLLEFKEQGTTEPRQMTEQEKKDMKEYNQKAKERSQGILNQAQNGKDFADLAKNNSEDMATKDKGGDIGFVGKTSNSKFYDAAREVGVGEVYYKLVENDTGYNILKITDRRAKEEVKANHILICYKGASRCDKDTSKDDARKKINELKGQAKRANFVDLAKANSTEPGAATSGGDLGWFARGMMVKPFEDAVFAMKVGAISDVVETEFGFHLIYKADARQTAEYQVSKILIKTKKEVDYVGAPEPWKYTGLSGKQLAKAILEFDPNTGDAMVGLTFNDEGKKLFSDITARNVGKPVAIFLDGTPITTPKVQEAINEGKAVITGKFTIAEAKQLALRLNAGALPVPIKLVSQETVGASLGQESVARSTFAGMLGLLIVAIFMILYYRLPGIISVFALFVYTALALAVFKIINVTLSSAGIAGFILSLGMAVDANILIFERLKEELRLDKPLPTAINEGFGRAWTSIRDSNISSLITCTVLLWFSSSIVKGFALTLAIGILVSMFSAITVTRILLKLVSGWPWFGNKPRLWARKSKQQAVIGNK